MGTGYGYVGMGTRGSTGIGSFGPSWQGAMHQGHWVLRTLLAGSCAPGTLGPSDPPDRHPSGHWVLRTLLPDLSGTLTSGDLPTRPLWDTNLWGPPCQTSPVSRARQGPNGPESLEIRTWPYPEPASVPHLIVWILGTAKYPVRRAQCKLSTRNIGFRQTVIFERELQKLALEPPKQCPAYRHSLLTLL